MNYLKCSFDRCKQSSPMAILSNSDIHTNAYEIAKGYRVDLQRFVLFSVFLCQILYSFQINFVVCFVVLLSLGLAYLYSKSLFFFHLRSSLWYVPWFRCAYRISTPNVCFISDQLRGIFCGFVVLSVFLHQTYIFHFRSTLGLFLLVTIAFLTGHSVAR